MSRLFKKRRKERTTGEDMCPHCYALNCDPMRRPRGVEKRMMYNREMREQGTPEKQVCPACGHLQTRCNCKSDYTLPKRLNQNVIDEMNRKANNFKPGEIIKYSKLVFKKNKDGSRYRDIVYYTGKITKFVNDADNGILVGIRDLKTRKTKLVSITKVYKLVKEN